MQFDHVTLVASDCEALMRFFVNVAGMPVGPRPPFGVDRYWLYLDGRPAVHLVASTFASPSVSASAETLSATRSDHMAFRVADASEWAALIERLDRHGCVYQFADVPLTGERQLFAQPARGVVVEFVIARS